MNTAYRTHFLQFFADKKYIYFSIYSIKHENVLFGVLSYGYPMGMLWLSYGVNSQLPYNTLSYSTSFQANNLPKNTHLLAYMQKLL